MLVDENDLMLLMPAFMTWISKFSGVIVASEGLLVMKNIRRGLLMKR